MTIGVWGRFLVFLLNSYYVMLEPVVFKLKNGNRLLYNFKKRSLLNLNENVYLLCNLFLNEKKTIDEICEHVKAHDISQSDFDYFLFLHDNGFLSSLAINLQSSVSLNSLYTAFYDLRIVVFEITKKCNLHCSYCIYGDLYDVEDEKYKNSYLSFYKAKSILDYIYQWCQKNKVNKRLTLSFYGGEPLLGFDVIRKIVEYTESFSSDTLEFKYDITTNGVLLSKYIDFLIKYDFSLLVSLDGDEYASSYRVNFDGKNYYNEISSVLLKIKKNNPDFFSKNIRFNSIIHQRNSLLKNVAFFKDRFGIIPYFTELTQINVRSTKTSDFYSIYKSLDDEYKNERLLLPALDRRSIRQEYSQLKGFIYNLLNKNHINNYSQLFSGDSLSIVPSSTCLPFSYKIFVSTDGLLYPCEKVGFKFVLGKINDSGEVFINYDSLKDIYDRLYSGVVPECTKCYNIFTCEVCLFSMNGKCKAITKNEFIRKMQNNLEDEDLSNIF